MMTTRQRSMAAEIMKALAHPIRLGVIEALSTGERTVTELYEELGCSQSMMSQQLKTLSQQKLITVRKEGIQKYCALNNRDFLTLFSYMDGHMRKHFNIEE
jgi:ArsR family transcriptional regulator